MDRAAKEAFVSGHAGTTFTEVTLAGLSIPASVFLFGSLAPFLPPSSSALLTFVFEFAVLVLPVLCAFCFADYVHHIVGSLFAVGLLLRWLARVRSGSTRTRHSGSAEHAPFAADRSADDVVPWTGPKSSSSLSSSGTVRRPFITAFRAGMMLGTCIAILAVDFPIFPRRFAKTETFGVSLMDVGVGAVTLSHALVWRADPSVHPNWFVRVVRTVRATAPLFLLGLARIAAVKSTDYQEHVSEYGVHWNFFFTLTVVSLVAALVAPRPRTAVVAGTVLLALYQAALLGGVTEYVLEAARTNLFAANREGILSCIGYIGIFFLGVGLRAVLLPQTAAAGWPARPRRTFATLALLTVFSWIATLAAHHAVQPCSRRLANAAYVLFVLAYDLSMLLVLWLCEAVGSPAPVLLDAVNRNAFLVFLTGNLLTGAVNLSMRTLYAPPALAFAVLTAYMLVLCGAARLLHAYNITLKFW